MGTESGPGERQGERSEDVAISPGAGDVGRERAPEFRTFLIADIRGYTRYTDAHGDEAAAALAARFADLVRDAVESRDGALVELRGDEALTVFSSTRQALRAAVEMQSQFSTEGLPTGVGIGLDAGEAVPLEGGYRGAALNVAARLCAQAGPGQILASETVVRLAAKIEGIRYTPARTVRLKGVESPVRVVGVMPDTTLTPVPRAAVRPKRAAVPQRTATVGLVLAVLVAAGGIALGLSRALSSNPGSSALITPRGSGIAVASGSRPSSSSGRPASSSTPPPVTGADVPMFLGLLDRANVMPGPGPEAEGKVPVRRWQFQGKAGMGQSPAVSGNLVYVGDLGGTLHVLDLATGSEQWSFTASAPIRTTPTISDGSVYFTSADGTFRAVDVATHQERWRVTGAAPDAIPTVQNDRVYLGYPTGRFAGLSTADATEAWHVDVGGDASLNAIHGDVAFVTSRKSDRLYAVETDSGRVRWQVSMGGRAVSAPAAWVDSVFVVVADAGGKESRLAAFDAATGRRTWTWSPPDHGLLDSLTVTDVFLYTSSSAAGSTTLWAVDPGSGQLVWPRHLPDASIKQTVVGRRMYVAAGTPTQTGSVRAVEVSSPDDLEAWYKPIGGAPAGAPVVTGGLVLVATAASPSDPGSVWALGDDIGTFTQEPEAWKWVADLTAGDKQPALYLDVAVDSHGNVYAADRLFNRVVIWDRSGKPTIWGKYGKGPGQFDFGGVTPGDASQSVAIAADGRIAVGDGGNHRVQIFDSKRHFIRSVGRLGRSPGLFINPCCVVFDPQGLLYVADPGRNDIQVFDTNGRFVRIIGSEGSGDGQFSRLGKPYIDPTTGFLWVPNYGNKRVEVMAPDGRFVARYGNGTNGNPELAEVNGVVLDSAGRMFIVDTDNFVWVLDSSGKMITRLGPEIPGGHGYIAPPYLALTPDGKLYLPEAAPEANRVIVMQLLSPLWPPP
jgi:class 3 adenylate cyclase/outer membrane protein assembly factor BamB